MKRKKSTKKRTATRFEVATDHEPRKETRGRPAIYNRDEILQVAKTAFSRSGYANVSLDDLATSLQTGKGTLYYHAKRKVDLLIAISEQMIGAGIAELRRIHGLKASPDVRFVMAMRAHMNAILSDTEACKIYFENEADLPSPIRGQLRAVRREVEDIFFSIVKEGVRAAVFTRDPHMAVRHIMAICLWPYRWYSAEGPLSKDEFIDNATDFALSALRTKNSLESVMSIEALQTSSSKRASPPGRRRIL